MSSLVGTYAKEAIAKGQLNWETADIRVALSTGFVFDVDADRYLSAMTNECAGVSYSRKILTGNSVVRVPGAVEMRADSTTWTGAYFGTPDVAVVYVYNALDSLALIIGVLDRNNLPTNTGDYTLDWDGQVLSGKLFSI